VTKQRRVLKNTPWDHPSTIRIEEGSPEWDEAYRNWMNGKNPTASPEWKTGVFFGYIKEAANG
jgi:hypothetical protein